VNEYEILLLLDVELGDERQAEIVTRVRELVEKGGGSWDLHDVWGRRKLAYEIDHKGEGSYHLLQFTCDTTTLDEASRVLRIDDGVMRHMATRRIQGSPARPRSERGVSRPFGTCRSQGIPTWAVPVAVAAPHDDETASDVDEQEE